MAEPTWRVGLVTGATGAIGRRLCERLRANGWRVIGLSTREVGKGPWDLHVAADLSNPIIEAVSRSLLEERIEVVWHLAGKAHALAESRQDESEYERVNVGGVRTALALAHYIGARRFVLASSVKAMGESSMGILDESSRCEPLTPYGRSKLAAEQLVLDRGDLEIDGVVLRFSMVYGSPYDRGNMGRMLDAVRSRRFPPLPVAGGLRSFVHVDDAVQACILAGTHQAAPNNVFIVTDGRPRSSAELQATMCSALGRNVPRVRPPVWLFRVAAWVGDALSAILHRRMPLDGPTLGKLLDPAAYSSEKIMHRLGYKPGVSLEQGIAAMIREQSGGSSG